ncbi:MAG: SLBB domain-containing protein [Acidobacteria bacterium]|nr:SLBB domain-containing protein [Acidobacteriota bacterium]
MTSISYEHLLQTIAAAGVVGLGGAGFPTHLKLRPRVKTVIINGAECEPLLRCDALLLRHYAAEVMSGAAVVAEATGAGEVVLAIKHKNSDLAALYDKQPCPVDFRVVLMDDVYPSGDEFFIIRDACGDILPARAIPVERGYLVSNAGTFRAIHDAVRGVPLTHRLVSVCGAVHRPVTVEAAVGTPLARLLAAAGGESIPAARLLTGGVMMGALAEPDDVVTKTTAAVVALPADHPAVLERVRPLRYSVRIAEHSCCQCLKCTELCSRFLIGHEIEPHKLMRLIGTERDYRFLSSETLFNCTGCGLCSLLACPFDLTPRRLILEARRRIPRPKTPDPRTPVQQRSAEFYFTPTGRLLQHLNLAIYEGPHAFGGRLEPPPKLRILLQQHAGPPAVPVVQAGQTVAAGERLAEAPAPDAGAAVHAPAAGRVTEVTARAVILSTGD